MTWATCTIHLIEHSASDGCPICRTNAENDRLHAIIDDLTATYPLTLSEAQARVDAARKMMEGL